MSSLENVKVGEQIAVWNGWITLTETVARITKTQVVCEEGQIYSKRTGRRRGTGYERHRAEPLTERVRERIRDEERERLHTQLARRIRGLSWKTTQAATVEDLEAALAIFAKYEEKAEG